MVKTTGIRETPDASYFRLRGNWDDFLGFLASLPTTEKAFSTSFSPYATEDATASICTELKNKFVVSKDPEDQETGVRILCLQGINQI